MTEIIILIVIGLLAGILSGAMGVGGGIVVVPALVFFLGLTQHQAQGTSMALLLPPIGILAVLNYSKQNYINWKYVLILSILFVIGAYIGSVVAVSLPERALKKIFGVLMLVAALKMIIGK